MSTWPPKLYHCALVRKVVDKSDEIEGENDIKSREDDIQSEGKFLNKKMMKAGFSRLREETVPNPSFVMW